MSYLSESQLSEYRQLLSKPHLAMMLAPLIGHIETLSQDLAAEKEKLRQALATLETQEMLQKIDSCRNGLS